MKYSRRMAGAALAAVLAAGMVVPTGAAKVGTIIGHALHTNIVAQINGHALRSYNVNDRTAVVAEDLVFCPEERIRVYDSTDKTMEEEIEGLGELYRNLRQGDIVLLNQPLLTVGNAPAREILANLLRAIHKKGAVARLATDLSVQ